MMDRMVAPVPKAFRKRHGGAEEGGIEPPSAASGAGALPGLAAGPACAAGGGGLKAASGVAP